MEMGNLNEVLFPQSGWTYPGQNVRLLGVFTLGWDCSASDAAASEKMRCESGNGRRCDLEA